MNMIVCVKQVPDPEAPPASFKIDPTSNKVVPPPGVAPVLSPFDEQAVEAALRIKDAKGGKVSIISLGNKLVGEVVKKPLSMGADDLFLLDDPAFEDSDSWSTAWALAAAIKKIGSFDIIFCGRQGADWDSGQVGSGLAEFLGIPSVTIARKVEASDSHVTVERVVADGIEVVEAPLPCLITVSNELGEPRYATMKGIMSAKKKPVTTWKPQDIGVSPAEIGKQGRQTELVKLYQPVKEGKCEIMQGDTPVEAAVALAVRLRTAKVI